MTIDFRDGSLHYTIVVRARTNLFGSFCQWVCFDFGRTSDNPLSTGHSTHSEWTPESIATSTVPKSSSQPASVIGAVLEKYTRFVRCLLLETSSKRIRGQITRLRDKLRYSPINMEQSAANNCLLIRKNRYKDASTKFRSSFLSFWSASSLISRALDEKLATAECGFIRPLEELVTQNVLFGELNRDNYRHLMRHLITLELVAEQRLLMGCVCIIFKIQILSLEMYIEPLSISHQLQTKQ